MEEGDKGIKSKSNVLKKEKKMFEQVRLEQLPAKLKSDGRVMREIH